VAASKFRAVLLTAKYTSSLSFMLESPCQSQETQEALDSLCALTSKRLKALYQGSPIPFTGGKNNQSNLAQTTGKVNAECRKKLSPVVGPGHYIIKLFKGDILLRVWNNAL
jgi:hypothetical protein